LISSCDTIDKQIKHIDRNIRQKLHLDAGLFRRTYRYTFILARASPAQKSLPLDVATEYWRLLFSPDHGGFMWSTPTQPWFEWWMEFLTTKWNRGVNRDMWDQLFVFVTKTIEDEELSFWSEDGAWPGAIDEFVLFVRDKRGVGEKAEESEDVMEE
jgi:DCN1-like protein 1/2